MGIANFRGEAVEGSAPRGTESRRSTSCAASSSSRGSNVIAGDNDDDDDFMPMAPWPGARGIGPTRRDRKSTRLNSSHGSISYAVFCLKKKKQKTQKGEILDK